MSATFNLDSHNQHLDDAAREIGRLNRWYEKALQDKKGMEENLRAQIQGLAQGALDSEDQIQFLTTSLHESQNQRWENTLERWKHKIFSLKS